MDPDVPQPGASSTAPEALDPSIETESAPPADPDFAAPDDVAAPAVLGDAPLRPRRPMTQPRPTPPTLLGDAGAAEPDAPPDAADATFSLYAPDPDGGRPPLPVLLTVEDGRSADPAVCPFLRLDAGGTLLAPYHSPADEHQCVAYGGPRPQSLRQQELVCLRAEHVDCPRYLRGQAELGGLAATSRPGASMPRATVAAVLILVLSAGVSFGFVIQRGGIDLPVVGAVTPTSSPIAIVTTPTPASTPGPDRRPVSTAAPTRGTLGVGSGERGSDPDPDRRPDRDTRPDRGPDRDAGPHAGADAAPDRDAQQRPVRPAQAVPRPEQLLDLRRAVRRQPVLDRELLRPLDDDHLPLEPEVRERRPAPRGRPDPDATADPLALRSCARRTGPPPPGGAGVL